MRLLEPNVNTCLTYPNKISPKQLVVPSLSLNYSPETEASRAIARKGMLSNYDSTRDRSRHELNNQLLTGKAEAIANNKHLESRHPDKSSSRDTVTKYWIYCENSQAMKLNNRKRLFDPTPYTTERMNYPGIQHAYIDI
jgi:hypothetical protein